MSYNTTLSLKEVQASRAQQQAYLSDLEATVEALKAEVSTLTADLQTAADNAEQAAAELTEMRRENGQLADTTRHLNNKIMTWEQLEQERSIQRLEQFAAVEAQSSAKDADIEKLQKANKELQAELKKARALNPERLNRQNKDLKKRLAESKDATTRINEQLRQAKSELKEMKVEQARAEKPLYRLAPNLLMGMAVPFIYITALEFISAQSPHTMKGLLLGVFYAIRGFFIILGCVFTFPFAQTELWQDCDKTLNCGFYYYLMNTLFGIGSMLVFMVAARWYQYRKREDRPYDHYYAESYYSRYTSPKQDDTQVNLDVSTQKYGSI